MLHPVVKISAARIYLVKTGSLHPVLLELVTDDGLVGTGEAAVAYGMGGTAAAGMVKDLIEGLLPGRDASRIEDTWAHLYDHSFWAKGGGPIVFAGISAIEQALWDIKGRLLGVPVYEMLGGRTRDDVRVYANGWSYSAITPDDYARGTEKVLRDGYDALKCYPLAMPNSRGGIRHVSRRSVDRDYAKLAFEKVKAIRDTAGPEIDIMADLSGGLTTDETIRFCHRLEDLNLMFVEEPADPFDLGALRKIADHIEIPIALGERIYTRYGFRPILEAYAVDIVQPDIGNTGGIMEAKKIAAMAEAYNARVQPHICASPVSTSAALQLAACIPNLAIQELYPYRSAEHFALVDHAPESDIHASRIAIPERPGLGISLVPDRVRPFLWAEISLI
jgi:galactonate dehydratase